MFWGICHLQIIIFGVISCIFWSHTAVKYWEKSFSLCISAQGSFTFSKSLCTWYDQLVVGGVLSAFMFDFLIMSSFSSDSFKICYMNIMHINMIYFIYIFHYFLKEMVCLFTQKMWPGKGIKVSDLIMFPIKNLFKLLHFIASYPSIYWCLQADIFYTFCLLWRFLSLSLLRNCGLGKWLNHVSYQVLTRITSPVKIATWIDSF